MYHDINDWSLENSEAVHEYGDVCETFGSIFAGPPAPWAKTHTPRKTITASFRAGKLLRHWTSLRTSKAFPGSVNTTRTKLWAVRIYRLARQSFEIMIMRLANRLPFWKDFQEIFLIPVARNMKTDVQSDKFCELRAMICKTSTWLLKIFPRVHEGRHDDFDFVARAAEIAILVWSRSCCWTACFEVCTKEDKNSTGRRKGWPAPLRKQQKLEEVNYSQNKRKCFCSNYCLS